MRKQGQSQLVYLKIEIWFFSTALDVNRVYFQVAPMRLWQDQPTNSPTRSIQRSVECNWKINSNLCIPVYHLIQNFNLGNVKWYILYYPPDPLRLGKQRVSSVTLRFPLIFSFCSSLQCEGSQSMSTWPPHEQIRPNSSFSTNAKITLLLNVKKLWLSEKAALQFNLFQQMINWLCTKTDWHSFQSIYDIPQQDRDSFQNTETICQICFLWFFILRFCQVHNLLFLDSLKGGSHPKPNLKRIVS